MRVPGARADVEADLPGVDRREEVAPEVREERAERRDDEDAEAERSTSLPVVERPVEVAAVGAAQPLEEHVEALVDAPDEVALRRAAAVVSPV